MRLIHKTQGGGSAGPTVNDKLFNDTYATAPNPIRFLPIYDVPVEKSKSGILSTTVRDLTSNIGYKDNYDFHPVDSAYQGIVATMNAQSEEIPEENEHLSALQVLHAGYKQLGGIGDDATNARLIEKLRFAGATDKEIEEVLHLQKMKKLSYYTNNELTKEQKQVQSLERHNSLINAINDITPGIQIDPATHYISVNGVVQPRNAGRPPSNLQGMGPPPYPPPPPGRGRGRGGHAPMPSVFPPLGAPRGGAGL